MYIKSKWGSLIFFLMICLFIQIIGWIFTASSVESWYRTLEKPFWNPPNWMFAPVWTLLYISIAISGWLVFLTPASSRKWKALSVYVAQLFVNLFWSYFFFFLKSPFLGGIDILVLLVLIGMTIYFFYPLNRWASLLLIPYFLWTLYAASLNLAIWFLN